MCEMGQRINVVYQPVTCYYAALLPRRGPHIASHSVRLSVCLSVRPVRGSSFVVFVYFFYSRTVLRANIQHRKTSVFAYGPASRIYFSARTEGRISYGHLGRTNLLVNEKALRETQTLHAGCSKAEPNIFAPPQTPFPGAQDGQNLISWRWSLTSHINPVWWRSMHAISSYRGNRPRNTHTNTNTATNPDRTDYNTLHR